MTDPARPVALPQLTSLRFFAAIYVLVFHSGTSLLESRGLTGPVMNLLKNGYLGVTFFFILSGFILTHSYLGRLSTRRQLGDFAMARFARVYPVYALAFLLALPLQPAPFSDLPLVAATLTLVQSWGSASSPAGFFWNSPGWTLSVEFFFYILFPLALPVVARLGTSGLWLALAVTALLLVTLRLPSLTPDSGARLLWDWMGAIPLPVLRAPEFLLGVLAARLCRRGLLDRLGPDLVVLMLASATIALLMTTSAMWISGYAALGFAAILVGCAVNSGVVRSVLSTRALVLLGGASYALYILQSPVRGWIYFVFTGDMAWFGRLVYQPLLIGLSVAVFLLVEEPARQLLRGLRVRKPLAAAGT